MFGSNIHDGAFRFLFDAVNKRVPLMLRTPLRMEIVNKDTEILYGYSSHLPVKFICIHLSHG